LIIHYARLNAGEYFWSNREGAPQLNQRPAKYPRLFGNFLKPGGVAKIDRNAANVTFPVESGTYQLNRRSTAPWLNFDRQSGAEAVSLQAKCLLRTVRGP
jgi:hypothetical protein